MVPKWVFPVFLAALVLVGAFSFSGDGIGQFAGNLFWEMIGIGATVFGVDLLIERQRVQRERPLRYVALSKFLQIDARINSLWRDMLSAASRGRFDGEVFSLAAARTISTLQLNEPANVIPPTSQEKSIIYWRKQIANRIAEIHDRGLQHYCSPELVKALDHLEASHFFSFIDSLETLASIGGGTRQGNFLWGERDTGDAFLIPYALFRTLLVKEVEDYIHNGEDKQMSNSLEHIVAGMSAKLSPPA